MKTIIADNIKNLRSPLTFEDVQFANDFLQTPTGVRHTIINGVPIMVKHPTEINMIAPPAEKISQNVPEYKVFMDLPKDAKILHLGSGNVLCKDPRVISFDILPCENVDIVGEAENLPFKDNVFDLIDSCAVFEHVHNPLTAIKEVKRVLKPNGILRIDNSFMQSYHGFPSHYFNMTCQANETYLVDDFELIQSAVPESGTPVQTVTMLLQRFFENVSKETMDKVNNMKVAEFMNLLQSDLTSNNVLMRDFSDYSKRAMAATHIVMAKKPVNYEGQLEQLKADGNRFGKWEIAKREYYAQRTAVQMRHHEIFFYLRLTKEQGTAKANRVNAAKLPEDLYTILKRCECQNFFDSLALDSSIKKLKKEENELRIIRDAVIAIYCS